MSAAPISPPAPAAEPAGASREPVAAIDASCRWPLLLLFCKALGWLLIATLLAIIGSIKLHAPGFLADSAWLTAGRVRPAAMNALVYGFASQAGMGVLLWLVCRLGGVRCLFQAPVIIAGLFWNLGVFVGVWAVLAGASTGFEWLEMPRYASPLLFISYAVIGLCAVANFCYRRERTLYVSQWFLLAALFWFPWIYSAANLLLVFTPVRGTLQAVVNAWYVGNLAGLWLGAVVLAAVFYFIPRLVGRPLPSAPLAAFAFWTYAFFTNWSGLTSLVGGPVPRWMPAVSTAANLLLIVPLVAVALNWHWTLAGRYDRAQSDPVLRFIVTGAIGWLAAGLLSVPLAFPQVAGVTNLTFVPLAVRYLLLLGAVTMVLLGCFYYILPRVTGVDWPRPQLVRAHYLCTLIGAGLIVGALAVGGAVQGFKMRDPNVAYVQLARSLTPWIGLSTLGWLWVLVGQVLLWSNVFALLRCLCAECCVCCAEWLPWFKTAKAGGQP